MISVTTTACHSTLTSALVTALATAAYGVGHCSICLTTVLPSASICPVPFVSELPSVRQDGTEWQVSSMSS